VLSPRYLEIAKATSNLWWNAARDSFTTGLGMLIQAVGSDDMREGAGAFVQKRQPSFRFPSECGIRPMSPTRRCRRPATTR
jgi:2-ketocyclohexanecarboxyl-CoA hydrolase